jgi:hypothetical protein
MGLGIRKSLEPASTSKIDFGTHKIHTRLIYHKVVTIFEWLEMIFVMGVIIICQGSGIHFEKKFGPNRNGRNSGKFGPISG